MTTFCDIILGVILSLALYYSYLIVSLHVKHTLVYVKDALCLFYYFPMAYNHDYSLYIKNSIAFI